jgi:hypothetical protein
VTAWQTFNINFSEFRRLENPRTDNERFAASNEPYTPGVITAYGFSLMNVTGGPVGIRIYDVWAR